jgi:lipoprotein-anchoring transpeptidase ErfK/SrfK
VLLIPPLGISQRLGQATRDKNGYLQIPIEDFPTLTEKWVDVDLSHQRVTAYEGTRPVASYLISSGRSPTPTVLGVFRIWAKISSQTMEGGSTAAGDYYNLPGVQWVSYFYRDYSFHGTYWHNNFGTPMSHGCINMTNRDAQALYEWMGPENPGRGWFPTPVEEKGTLVVVHR